MNRGLVALSASAIAAVYAAGYVRTQAADTALGLAESVPTAQVATVVPATQPPAATPFLPLLPRGRGGGDGSQPSVPATSQPPPAHATPPATRATAAPTAAPSAATTYKDGTYTGVGQSRRGGGQVALTVQGGRIASVNITRVSTQYPVSDIASLPAQVVARQSAQVDRVSGATYSRMAFRGAVQQALSQAQA